LTSSIWHSHFRSSQLTGPARSGFWSLSTNNGFFLHFCETGLLAIPASVKDSAKLGAIAGAGLGDFAQRLVGASPPSGTRTPITDTGDEAWLRFPLNEIDSIICRRNKLGFGKHKVEISATDGKQSTFGLFIRADFDLIVQTLKSLYGDLVTEE
jgi:hypothetical protein